jgi:hypothetical protein
MPPGPDSTRYPAKSSSEGRAALGGALLVSATWGSYLGLLWLRMLERRPDGLYAGWRTVWADWVAHFAYANVFAYRAPGHWFAVHPLFATAPFDYPFAADALSGLLMRAGVDRVPAFLAPSLVASILLCALLGAFYGTLLRSAGAALLAATLFFTNGGLGFLLWVQELARRGSLELVRLPPREYTYVPDRAIEWINVVTSEILPQRAILFGLTIGLAVLVMLWRWRARSFRGVSALRLCGLGALASLLVVTHLHSFLALAAICAVLFATDLRHARAWLLFAAGAALPALALLAIFYPSVGARGGFLTWYPGWLANPAEGRHVALPIFLLLNWGFFLPVAAVAALRLRENRTALTAAGFLLFALCFLVRFQPYAWDNTKVLTWAHLLLCVPVARYLANLWSRGRATRAVAVALLVACTASGGLDLWRLWHTSEVSVRMWTTAEIDVARRFREISPPDALVLTGDDHHHWVPALAGRPVLLGFPGWLASYGFDYGPVERDVATMLQGGPEAEVLMRRYGVRFVAIGPRERVGFGADPGYFRAHHELVLEGAGYQIFAIRPAPGPGGAG